MENMTRTEPRQKEEASSVNAHLSFCSAFGPEVENNRFADLITPHLLSRKGSKDKIAQSSARHSSSLKVVLSQFRPLLASLSTRHSVLRSDTWSLGLTYISSLLNHPNPYLGGFGAYKERPPKRPSSNRSKLEKSRRQFNGEGFRKTALSHTTQTLLGTTSECTS